MASPVSSSEKSVNARLSASTIPMAPTKIQLTRRNRHAASTSGIVCCACMAANVARQRLKPCESRRLKPGLRRPIVNVALQQNPRQIAAAGPLARPMRDKAPRDKPWIFGTYAGHSTAAASNALYRKNLSKGQTGLSVAFDLPTQTGYDSDHPLAKGEVGKVGVPISHIGDMRMLF